MKFPMAEKSGSSWSLEAMVIGIIGMAISIVEFSRKGYKIRKGFGKKKL